MKTAFWRLYVCAQSSEPPKHYEPQSICIIKVANMPTVLELLLLCLKLCVAGHCLILSFQKQNMPQCYNYAQ